MFDQILAPLGPIQETYKINHYNLLAAKFNSDFFNTHSLTLLYISNKTPFFTLLKVLPLLSSSPSLCRICFLSLQDSSGLRACAVGAD